MLVNGGFHHAAGAVALDGVADLFGGRQAHAGLFAPCFEDVEHQRRVDIRLAAGIHAAKLRVAADGTIAHLLAPPSSRIKQALHKGKAHLSV